MSDVYEIQFLGIISMILCNELASQRIEKEGKTHIWQPLCVRSFQSSFLCLILRTLDMKDVGIRLTSIFQMENSWLRVGKKLAHHAWPSACLVGGWVGGWGAGQVK